MSCRRCDTPCTCPKLNVCGECGNPCLEQSGHVSCGWLRQAREAELKLTEAHRVIRETLEVDLPHLSDGEDCSLRQLKKYLMKVEPGYAENVRSGEGSNER